MKSDINFEYIEEFVDYIVDRVESDDELFLTVVGKFEEIKGVIKEIITIRDVNFDFLQIESPEMSDYCDEFVLSLWMNGDVLEIGCEFAKRDGEYLNFVGEEVYLFDNVSSKIIPLCEDANLYFVSINDNCDCECCQCDCCKDEECEEYRKVEDEDIHGFTAQKSTDNGYYYCSYYTDDVLSEDELRVIVKRLLH